MIFGSYPCCDGDLSISLPERTPVYMAENCPHCGAKVWHLLSRIDPMSWTEADFLAEFEVDEATKKVKERYPRTFTVEMEGDFSAFIDYVNDLMVRGDSTTEPTGFLSEHIEEPKATVRARKA